MKAEPWVFNRMGVRDGRNRGVKRTLFFFFSQGSGSVAFPFSEMGKSRKAAYLGGGVEDQGFSFGGMKFEAPM